MTEFDPFETGLDRFVKMDKPDFVGKAALVKRQEEGLRHILVTLTLESNFAAAHGGASVMVGDKVVGTVTSGGWGHRLDLNLAYVFIDPDLSAIGTALEVDVLGHRISAVVSEMGAYDPTMALVRG